MLNFRFDLQLFGGGGGETHTTTVQERNIPEQTALEAQLERELGDYNNSGMESAKRFREQALYDLEHNTYNPDWEALKNKYDGDVNAALNEYIKTGAGNTSAYEQALKDYQAQYEQDTRSNLDAYKNDSASNLADYNASRDNALAQYQANAQADKQKYQDALSQRLQDYTNSLQNNQKLNEDNLKRFLEEYENASKRNADTYTGSLSDALTAYQKATGSALSDYNTGMSEVDAQTKALMNGELPSAYNENFQKSMESDLTNTYGNTISDLARRGILNSSTANTSFGNISKSVADASAKNYQSSIAQLSSLNQTRASNLADTYKARVGSADSNYANATTTAGNIYKVDQGNADNFYNQRKDTENTRYKNYGDVIQSVNSGAVSNIDKAYASDSAYTSSMYNNRNNNADTAYKAQQSALDKQLEYENTRSGNVFNNNTATAGNIYNAQSSQNNNAYTNKINALQNGLLSAATAQVQSYYKPQQYFNYAQNLANSAENQYNTLYSGRMGSGSTTTTTTSSGGGSDNSGSIIGAVGSVGSALISACFTAGTKVTTPTGYKNIEDIKVGDEVLSLNKYGDVVRSKVILVNEPVKSQTVVLHWDNGTRWRTTISQRYFDGKHFAYVGSSAPAVVFQGRPTQIANLEEGPDALVYDFAVDGDLNVFFANDVASEGYGD